ncbi:hypothetical protein, partial [Duffyella gerundensis]|uniref:hypothetical protein n=1 Tax=Duffyella gerundensis TaxID=1619313 RepID=UPI001CA38CE7
MVLPEGSPSRTKSKAISYRLKPARAGPAVAPALHPRYPANTTAHSVGALGKSFFLTDPARFAPGSTRLLAASLRLALENAFPSAFVMPLKVKTQVKIEKIKDEILNKTSISKENPKPKTQNPKPKTQNPKPKTQNPKPKTQNSKLKTQNSKPKTQNPKPKTQNSQFKTQNSKHT